MNMVVSAVWLQILEPLEKMRRENDMVKMFPPYLCGEELFGLTEPAVVRVIESVSAPLILDTKIHDRVACREKC